MRGRNISCFVAPDCPGTEAKLATDQYDPQDRQSLQNNKARRIPPDAKTKRDHSDGDDEREEPVRHLQPDLECSHIRYATRVPPRVDLCKRSCTGVWNPRAVCRWKIKN